MDAQILTNLQAAFVELKGLFNFFLCQIVLNFLDREVKLIFPKICCEILHDFDTFRITCISNHIFNNINTVETLCHPKIVQTRAILVENLQVHQLGHYTRFRTNFTITTLQQPYQRFHNLVR